MKGVSICYLQPFQTTVLELPFQGLVRPKHTNMVQIFVATPDICCNCFLLASACVFRTWLNEGCEYLLPTTIPTSTVLEFPFQGLMQPKYSVNAQIFVATPDICCNCFLLASAYVLVTWFSEGCEYLLPATIPNPSPGAPIPRLGATQNMPILRRPQTFVATPDICCNCFLFASACVLGTLFSEGCQYLLPTTIPTSTVR